MIKDIFSYCYTVHFADTDAAGVVYFANALRICHQAYENSLKLAGFDLKEFFNNSSFAMPIIHAEVDFFAPLYCGDEIIINLEPKLLSDKIFTITYNIVKNGSKSAQAQTKHICINPTTRKTQPLPEQIKLILPQ